MATLKAIAGGTTTTLTGGGTTYRVLMQNSGMAPVRSLTQRGPLQDGVTATGYRLDPRNLRLTFFFQAASLSAADDRRQTIYNIFRPRAALMTLEETLDNGDVRRIDGRVTGTIDMPLTPTQERIGVSQIFSVDFFCPDPTWYNPTASTTTFDTTSEPDWWLALNTITSGQVEEHVETPTQDQSIDNSVSVADGQPFTVYFRTTAGSSPVSQEQPVQLYDGTDLVLAAYGAGTNRALIESFEATGFFGTAQADYFLISDGTNAYAYRDATLVDSGTGAIALDGTNALSVWRGNGSGGASWTPAIPNGAIYNIALSEAQRTALISAVNGDYSATGTISNAGNYPAYPIITITGPIADAVLTNVTTSETLDFDGITIASGETRVIDCRYGYKTVKDATGTNKIADLTAASDLAMFHLEPGNNAFTLTGTSTDANTKVTITFNTRYLGI